jgi:hypothetical protein
VHISRTILGPEFYCRPGKKDAGFGDRAEDDGEDEEEKEEEDSIDAFSDIDDDNDSTFDERWYRNNGNSDEDGRPSWICKICKSTGLRLPLTVVGCTSVRTQKGLTSLLGKNRTSDTAI